MPVSAEVIDPLADARWAAFVESCAEASVFHHPLWLRLLREQYRYPLWACCLVRDGAVVAGVPVATVRSRLTGNRLVTLPFSDHVAPLYGDDAEDLREPLLQGLEDERRRRGLPLEIHAPVPELPGLTTGDRFHQHVVTLGPDAEALLGRVKSSHRRNVRRAVAEGVSVQRRTDRGAVEAFFRMHVLTRRRQGSPTQPKGFFLRMQRLFDAGLGFVLVASWRDRPIAAAVYLQFNGVLVYKYGASDPRHLDKRANPLIHFESIRYGSEQGHHTLDLGRTDLDNPGLRRFKLGFGAEEHELVYSFAGRDTGEADSVRAVSGLQQTLIRRAPSPFGRFVGAALYRHFG